MWISAWGNFRFNFWSVNVAYFCSLMNETSNDSAGFVNYEGNLLNTFVQNPLLLP